MWADPESAKKDWQLDCIFWAFGIWKAAHKTLEKLTPGVNLWTKLIGEVLENLWWTNKKCNHSGSI